MPGRARPVGQRPRWPELVIALALVALALGGVAAIFGPSIRAWLAGEDTAPPAPTTAPAGSTSL